MPCWRFSFGGGRFINELVLKSRASCIISLSLLYQRVTGCRYSNTMSSPASHPTSVSARELYLLRQRAETFRVELELENQLRLRGAATLPPEWSTYLEHQRQLLLDTIQRIESREEDFTSSLETTHDTHPTRSPPSIQGRNESTGGSPIRPEESVRSLVLPINEGNAGFFRIGLLLY
jgi:hypothetical protein